MHKKKLDIGQFRIRRVSRNQKTKKIGIIYHYSTVTYCRVSVGAGAAYELIYRFGQLCSSKRYRVSITTVLISPSVIGRSFRRSASHQHHLQLTVIVGFLIPNINDY